MPLPEDLRAAHRLPRRRHDQRRRRPLGRHARRRRFLGEFVPAGLPWVHLDIAGPAYNQGGARDYTPKGGTGAAVRTMIAAAASLTE